MEQKHIKDIFARADLRQICEFLDSGLELDKPDNRSYSQRLEDGSINIVDRLKKFSQNEQEFSDMYDDFSEATVMHTKVFLEIGMKAGARILFKLLFENEYTV